MNALELKVPPLALVAIAAAGMWAVALVAPKLDVDFPGAVWVASALLLAGVLIAVLGVLAFRRAGTTVDPRVPEQSETLVVRGVYRFSRNPMYLGFLLILGAWCLYLGSLLSALFLPTWFAWMNRFQIIPEERFMLTKFGDSYTRYCAAVRRWV